MDEHTAPAATQDANAMEIEVAQPAKVVPQKNQNLNNIIIPGGGNYNQKSEADVAKETFVTYLLAYHERNFCNKVAPVLGKLTQQRLEELTADRKHVLSLDRNIETTIILARNAGSSVASCCNFLLDGSIRQNYCTSAKIAEQDQSLTLGKELELFAKACPGVKLPDERFGSWKGLGDYYESFGRVHFFDEEISGGAALARLLKECEASVRFATPNLPSSYSEVLEHLRKELSQSGGTGLSMTSWQDVVTRLFQATTHQVLQNQIGYVTHRLCWFLKRQKQATVAWMTTLQNSSDEPWFSKLYSKHGELLSKRKEIKKAVFEAYDAAVDESCATFQRIFLQVIIGDLLGDV